jgi:hypothetical protein
MKSKLFKNTILKLLFSFLFLCFFYLNAFSQLNQKDFKNRKGTILISDLSKCTPASAITKETTKNTWRTADYELENFKGTMLTALVETTAPLVSLPLNVKGWYAVYLGLYRLYPNDGIRVKLTNDEATTLVQADKAYDYFEEVFWKYADLTNQEIIFQQPELRIGSSYICFVKLVPLNNDEVKKIQSYRENKENKNLIALNDGHGVFYNKRPYSIDGVIEDIEPYRNTDFGKLYWCVGSGGDVFTFPSKNGKIYGQGAVAFSRSGDRNVYESMMKLKQKGIDILKTVVDYSHKCGIEIYLSERMEAFMHPIPWDSTLTGYFYVNHPELRCKDIDGSEIARLSYAYPEMQDFMLKIFKELTTYKPDGISLLFNRGAPYLLYEEPIVKAYKDKTGIDATKINEKDPQYIKFRATFMTEFMRKLRNELNSQANILKVPKFKLSAHVLNDSVTNIFYGLDLAEWIKEGLVDEIVAYPWNDNKLDIDYFVRLVKNTNCKLYAEMMPRKMSPEDYRGKAIEMYKKGVDGLSFWDTNSRHPNLKQWSMISRLGNKNILNSIDDGNETFFKVLTIKNLNGFRMDKYTPGDCF